MRERWRQHTSERWKESKGERERERGREGKRPKQKESAKSYLSVANSRNNRSPANKLCILPKISFVLIND